MRFTYLLLMIIFLSACSTLSDSVDSLCEPMDVEIGFTETAFEEFECTDVRINNARTGFIVELTGNPLFVAYRNDGDVSQCFRADSGYECELYESEQDSIEAQIIVREIASTSSPRADYRVVVS